MISEISDYPDVNTRLRDLGSSVSKGLLLLPDNFETANTGEVLLYPPDTATLRKVLEAAGVPMAQVAEAPKIAYVVNRSAAWMTPVLFISTMLLTDNAMAVSIGLNVASSFITDILRGIGGPKHVKFDLVVERERDGICKRIKYEGDPSGIPALLDVIKVVAGE